MIYYVTTSRSLPVADNLIDEDTAHVDKVDNKPKTNDSDNSKLNEMNRALGHFCAHTG